MERIVEVPVSTSPYNSARHGVRPEVHYQLAEPARYPRSWLDLFSLSSLGLILFQRPLEFPDLFVFQPCDTECPYQGLLVSRTDVDGL